ncbi:hypothetical protein [Brevibacillus migulae]|uniref:hypothetical protein n=1 Tax=Brevibacillus migulae TaxID=1644114 RepID=UPI00106E186D|nr:hypothetical protein [Brevibacillus migulae]
MSKAVFQPNPFKNLPCETHNCRKYAEYLVMGKDTPLSTGHKLCKECASNLIATAPVELLPEKEQPDIESLVEERVAERVAERLKEFSSAATVITGLEAEALVANGEAILVPASELDPEFVELSLDAAAELKVNVDEQPLVPAQEADQPLIPVQETVKAVENVLDAVQNPPEKVQNPSETEQAAPDRVPCPYCSGTFKGERGLKAHIIQTHPEKWEGNGG